MMELTDAQQECLAGAKSPPIVVNPSTKERFVLVPEDEYDKLCALLTADNQKFAVEMAPQMSRIVDEE